MAIERHDGNELAVDSGAARTDGGEHRAGPCGERRAGDRPMPEERRSRSELHAALRATDTGTDSPARPVNRDAPRTTPEGAWEWKGLRLEPDANRVADRELSARRSAELSAIRSRQSSVSDLYLWLGYHLSRSSR